MIAVINVAVHLHRKRAAAGWREYAYREATHTSGKRLFKHLYAYVANVFADPYIKNSVKKMAKL